MRTLGIELGATGIRAVIGENRRGRLHLHEAFTVPVASDSPDALAVAVAGLVQEHGKGVRQVVVSLPRRQCIVKLLSFPATSEENLERLARAAAETTLPLPADQMRFDHAVLDTGDASRQATVAMAACRTDVLDALVQPLESQGVKSPVIDAAPLALANVFAEPVRHSGTPTAILELSDDEVMLIFLDAAGRLTQVRNLAVEPAEIAEEVRRSLQAYGAQNAAATALLVVGAGAVDAAEALDATLPLPVTVGDPWPAMAGAGGDLAQAATYAVATGLALRGGEVPCRVNLRSRPKAEAQRRETNLATAVVVTLFLALLATGVFFYQSLHSRKREAQLAKQEREKYERLLTDAGGEDPEYLDTLRAKAEQVRRDSDWLTFLQELATGLPGGLSIEELNLDHDRPVTIRGQAFTNGTIAQAMDMLNGTGRFEKVRLDFATAEQIGDERVYNFQVTCSWPVAGKGKTP